MRLKHAPSVVKYENGAWILPGKTGKVTETEESLQNVELLPASCCGIRQER